MRPTTSIMLQQNNNNNYPCLNVSGSGREMLQKCSRASLPFPSRLELGLGDLPLIRGLRAWALCSKNRCKAGGLLGGGQAPAAPPVGRGSSTPCPRPADVYLSGEWGRMGYGLPLGLDSRQAGIGALVTVATLKTSEGSGKTQTQCLVLRTEKGNCLYPTAKPGSGGAAGASSGVVGGWLRGKTGGRDAPAGRRDNGPALPAQTGANRVRVRSGRRWRKSSNTAGREKTGVSRERRQRSREDPAGERQEERDKGGLDGKAFPGPQQDGRRARPEREGACRSPRCCHRVSPKSCPQCGRRAQRRESQDDGGGGESPRAGFSNGLSGEGKGMRRERRKNEEEEKEGVVESESSDSILAAQNPDLESNRSHLQAPGGRDGEEVRGADSSEELKTQSSQSEDDHSEKERDSDSENMKTHTGNTGFIHVRAGQLTGDFKSRNNREPAVEATADVNRLPDEESEKPTDGAEVEVEERSISQAPAELPLVSNRYQDVSAPASPASVGAAVRPESSAPPGGSTCAADHEARWVKRGREDGRVEHVEGRHRGQDDPRRTGKQELDVSRSEPQEPSCVADGSNTVKPPFFYENEGNNVQLVEREAMSSPVRRGRPYVFEMDGRSATENSCDRRTAEPERRDGPGSVEERAEERLNPEGGAEEIGGRKRTCSEPNTGDGKGHGDKERHSEEETVGTVREEDYKEVRRKHAPQDNGGPQGSGDGHRGRGKTDGDTCTETSTTRLEENGEAGAGVSDVARADPSSPPPLSPANPVASLAPLGSMATGRPRPEEEEEQEEEEEGGLAATAGAGSREGKRGYGRELEEQGQEERGPMVAAVEGRKKAEEEEEEEQEEEDEFGVFMQAEGEPAWSKGFTMSASVPCGSRESAAPVITGQPSLWTPGWTTDGGSSGGSDGGSDDAWTAFPQDPTDKGREVVGLWWPTSAAEEAKEGRPSANRNLASVFAEAFPSPPGSPGDPSDPEAVPTLTRLLGGRTSQDQGLLDGFHDLNKMIGQRYKRASGVSRDLLLRTLHLQQSQNESRPAPWTASRRLSPGLPSANQHAQNAAAKRRLSYDHSRDTAE